MAPSELSFQEYLRSEVDTAGKNYELARARVFALTAGPMLDQGPALLEATERLAESMQVYISSLRRLAHYAAHKSALAAEKPLTTHA